MSLEVNTFDVQGVQKLPSQVRCDSAYFINMYRLVLLLNIADHMTQTWAEPWVALYHVMDIP